MHETLCRDCYYNIASRVILSVSIRGRWQESRKFVFNPTRKFDVTSGPKREDFLLRTAEKNLT